MTLKSAQDQQNGCEHVTWQLIDVYCPVDHEGHNSKLWLQDSAQNFPGLTGIPKDLGGLHFCVYEVCMCMCVGLSVLCVNGVCKRIKFSFYEKICVI